MTILTNQTDIDAITEKLQALIGNIAGIRSSTEDPPDSLGSLPAVFSYFSGGEYITGNFGVAESHHEVTTEVHFSKNSIPDAIEESKRLIKLIPQAIASKPTLDGLCNGFEKITYQFVQARSTDTTYRMFFTIVNLKLYPYGVKDNPTF